MVEAELGYLGQSLYWLDRGLTMVDGRRISKQMYNQFLTNYEFVQEMIEGFRDIKLNQKDSQRLMIHKAISSTLLRKIDSLEVISEKGVVCSLSDVA